MENIQKMKNSEQLGRKTYAGKILEKKKNATKYRTLLKNPTFRLNRCNYYPFEKKLPKNKGKKEKKIKK